MRKFLLPLFALLLVSFSTSLAQGLMDYVDAVRGDTLVIKDYYDMNEQPSSINNVITVDTLAPATRVYELKTAGWYPQSGGVTTPSGRPTVIVGADHDILVKRAANAAPPIISGFTGEGGSNPGGFIYGDDFTIKNTSIVLGSPDGTGGWAFFQEGAPDVTCVFENNMMEHNWWVFVRSNAQAGNSFYFRDNYFVNMSGRQCRRNGGVYDNVDNNTALIYVENNTHIMGQGYIYKFRNYPIDFIYVNHNTFINCVNVVFETQGVQSNTIITNNIFVNSNIIPWRPNHVEDMAETAYDQVPQGLIDVALLPETMDQVDRKWLVEANLAYWDTEVSDLATESNNIAVGGFTTWVNQSMKMNDRTKALFDDNANYPYMVEGVWYDQLPTFTNPADLLTDQLELMKEYTIAVNDTTATLALPDWRVTSTGDGSFVYSDWPIPVDLSYSDAELLTGATDGLPVGDLNWFPESKATFVANHTQYYDALVAAWNEGRTVINSIKELGGLPTEFELMQNYPNPFNPTTVINFTLPKSANVSLKVYNAIGQEVATLVNGFMTAQNYEITFDASHLASGVYVYTLQSDNFSQSKKMILMK